MLDDKLFWKMDDDKARGSAFLIDQNWSLEEWIRIALCPSRRPCAGPLAKYLGLEFDLYLARFPRTLFNSDLST